MERQRIWILTRHFPPDAGALSYRIDHLARTLGETHDVTVLAAQPNRYGKEPRAPKREQDGSVTIRRVSQFRVPGLGGKLGRLLSEFGGAVWMALVALRHRRHIDVGVASVPPLTYALPGWAIKRLGRRRLVLDVRDLWVDWAEESALVASRLGLRILRGFERRMITAADHITVTTAGFRAAIGDRHRVAATDITVIYNGLDAAIAPESTAERRPDPGEALHVLYAGNLGPSQNMVGIVDGLTQSLTKWRNLTVTIVGDGAQAGDLALASHERLTIRSHVDRDVLRDLYAGADAFLVHLAALDVYRHTIPSKIFEYAAHRRPIVCGVQGEARALAAAHTDCFFFESDDPESLSLAIDRLASGAAADNADAPRADPTELLRESRSELWKRVVERVT